MSTEPVPPPPLVMLGAPDAAVCEDDSCLLPGANLVGGQGDLEDRETAQVDPAPVGAADDPQED
jgi:hypothetical protein